MFPFLTNNGVAMPASGHEAAETEMPEGMVESAFAAFLAPDVAFDPQPNSTSWHAVPLHAAFPRALVAPAPDAVSGGLQLPVAAGSGPPPTLPAFPWLAPPREAGLAGVSDFQQPDARPALSLPAGPVRTDVDDGAGGTCDPDPAVLPKEAGDRVVPQPQPFLHQSAVILAPAPMQSVLPETRPIQVPAGAPPSAKVTPRINVVAAPQIASLPWESGATAAANPRADHVAPRNGPVAAQLVAKDPSGPPAGVISREGNAEAPAAGVPATRAVGHVERVEPEPVPTRATVPAPEAPALATRRSAESAGPAMMPVPSAPGAAAPGRAMEPGMVPAPEAPTGITPQIAEPKKPARNGEAPRTAVLDNTKAQPAPSEKQPDAGGGQAMPDAEIPSSDHDPKSRPADIRVSAPSSSQFLPAASGAGPIAVVATEGPNRKPASSVAEPSEVPRRRAATAPTVARSVVEAALSFAAGPGTPDPAPVAVKTTLAAIEPGPVSADALALGDRMALSLPPERGLAVPAAGATPDIARGLGQQVAEAAARFPDRPIELTLAPEELGRVRLTLATTEAGLTMNVLADRPETLDLLRRNIDQLAQDFRDLGFTNLAFSFGKRQDGAPQQPPAPDNAATDQPAAPQQATAVQATAAPRPDGSAVGLDLRF